MKSAVPDTWLFPSRRNIATWISSMSTSFWVSDSWLVRTFVCLGWISSPCASVHLFCFFELVNRACQQKNVVSKSQVWHASLCFRLPIWCHSSFPSKSQCLSPLLTGEPNWAESCWKDLLVSCLEQSGIHHSPRPSAKWRVGQHANFQKTDVLLTGRMVSERSPNRVMPYRVKRRFENRPLPPRCLFTFTAFSNNESVRH